MTRFVQSALPWAIALAALSVGVSHAAEYYIAPGGSDSNGGSIGSPFASFSKAIGLATAGDTIYARGGTYNLNSRFQSAPASRAQRAAQSLCWPIPAKIRFSIFAARPTAAATAARRGLASTAVTGT